MTRTMIAALLGATLTMSVAADAQTKYYARENLNRFGLKTAAPSAGSETGIVLTAIAGSACVQIAEVEVYANGVNVAAAANGGTATGTSVWSSESNAPRAIDGVKPASYPNIYHSACYNGDTLTVTFARPVKVERIVVWGRQDYGPERDMFSYSLTGGSPVRTGVVDARSGMGSANP